MKKSLMHAAEEHRILNDAEFTDGELARMRHEIRKPKNPENRQRRQWYAVIHIPPAGKFRARMLTDIAAHS